MRFARAFALAAALAFAVAADAGAQTAEPTAAVKEAVREIIREYLLEHPEVIEQAMIALNAKRRQEKRARERAALMENRAVLTNHPLSPVSGNPDGGVTLVEFFDYQCGYCKRSLGPVLVARRLNRHRPFQDFLL